MTEPALQALAAYFGDEPFSSPGAIMTAARLRLGELESERDHFREALERIADGTWESFRITGADDQDVIVEGHSRFVSESTLATVLRIARDALMMLPPTPQREEQR